MPFDVVGFYESGVQTLANQVTPVADTQYSIVGADYYLVQKYAPFLAGVFHSAISTPARCQVFQPKLTPPHNFIKSVLIATANPSQGLSEMMARPMPLNASEQIAFRAVNASNEATLGALFLASGACSQSQLDQVKPTHKLTGFSDTDHVAGAWTNLPITWDDVLPEGRYAIVGMKVAFHKAANPGNGVARLILIDSAWRPGCLASIQTGDRTLTVAQEEAKMFNEWPLMPDISFDNISPPQTLQCLSGMANENTEIELTLQKIG